MLNFGVLLLLLLMIKNEQYGVGESRKLGCECSMGACGVRPFDCLFGAI